MSSPKQKGPILLRVLQPVQETLLGSGVQTSHFSFLAGLPSSQVDCGMHDR